MAIMIAWAFAGYGDGNDLARLVVVYSVGRYATDHRYSLAIVLAAMAAGVLETIVDANQRIDIAPRSSSPGSPGTSAVGCVIVATIWPSCENAPNGSRPTNMPRRSRPSLTNEPGSPANCTTSSLTRSR